MTKPILQDNTELHDLIGEVYHRAYVEALEDASVPADFYSESKSEGCAQVQADLADRLESLKASSPLLLEEELVEAVRAAKETKYTPTGEFGTFVPSKHWQAIIASLSASRSSSYGRRWHELRRCLLCRSLCPMLPPTTARRSYR